MILLNFNRATKFCVLGSLFSQFRNQTGPLLRLMGRKGKEAMDLTELDYLERAEALRGKLYGIALLTLGGEAAAIDAVDEAVYKGYRNYRKLRQPQYFETWLIRILINVCRDELRRRKRELAVETLPETAGDAYDALPLFLPDGRRP